MRCDVLNTDADADHLEALVRRALRAVDEPDLFGAKSHLKTPNGGRIYVSPSLVNSAESGATLHSEFADAEHNAWAIEVFDALCAAAPYDVELFDEDDHVIRARHHTAV